MLNFSLAEWGCCWLRLLSAVNIFVRSDRRSSVLAEGFVWRTILGGSGFVLMLCVVRKNEPPFCGDQTVFSGG